MLGSFLDRCCFWPLPGWISSYHLPVPHRRFFHHNLEVWHVPGRPGAPTVLFCHGNAGNLRFPNARRNRILAMHAAGANLYTFDYRGFGRSPGRPTETGLYQDARTIHQLVQPAQGALILFGRSLGGAVATYLATEIQAPDALILESTFTSAPDVCASYLGTRLAKKMSYQFNSLERIRRLTCPLFSIHGTADRVVPHALGQQLFAACPTGQEMISVPNAGHNNLQRMAAGTYESTLQRWLGG